MRVGAIQSSYIPWRGYFDFIASVDLFVIYDDVQFSKQSWRNRNYFKSPEGRRFVTVPVRVRQLSQLICETGIDYHVDWIRKHENTLRALYGRAPFFGDAFHLWVGTVSTRPEMLTALNVRLIRDICGYLGIRTPLRMASEFRLAGKSTDRLLDLLRKTGATTYLTGPTAKGYLDESMIRGHGFALEYKSYDYMPYPQRWGEFVGEVSIIDLIANMGPRSMEFVRSRTADVSVLADSP